MVEIIECPICKSRGLQHLVNCIDHTVSHETFQIQKCETCTHGITSPRPDNDKLGSYYESSEYISHSGKSAGGMGLLYKIARSFSLKWKSGLIRKHKKQGSILDLGCGTGEFLHTLQKTGWSVTGIEPSTAARSKAQSLIKQTVYNSLSEVGERKFDVITAWHVLEHVPDLTETILRLKGLLQKDGIIFIAVPNHESPDAHIYNDCWAGFDVPRHLWHFTKRSMSKLMESNSLKITATIPMRLDAYYVSMLSEKYKSQNMQTPLSLVKGFITGLRSNLAASKNKNHSSLIYIVQFL